MPNRERITDLTEVQEITNTDYVMIDSANGGVRKLKASSLGGGGGSNEIKLGNWFTLAKGSSTDAKDNLNVNQYNITWNGGTAISSGILGNFDISNYSKVKVKLTTRTSYYNTVGTHELRKIWCGLTPQKYTSMFTPSSITWNSVEKYFTDNSETTIELTPTAGVLNYINITTFGWNVDIEVTLIT